MPLSKRFTADTFFILQLILALVSGGSQFVRLLTTAQGVSVSWLASSLTFLVINLILIIRAHDSWPTGDAPDRAYLRSLDHGHRCGFGRHGVDGPGDVGRQRHLHRGHGGRGRTPHPGLGKNQASALHRSTGERIFGRVLYRPSPAHPGL